MAGALDRDAQFPEAAQRRGAIGRRREILDPRRALRECAEDGEAVGEGLVPGKREAAAEVAGGSEEHDRARGCYHVLPRKSQKGQSLTLADTRATVRHSPSMKPPEPRTVKLDFASRFDMLEIVQTVLVQLAHLLGFGEDATHYMSVALRESVVNAIKHGNKQDEAKRVFLEFTLHPTALEMTVRDQGAGFDPTVIPDPVAPENLLRTFGRGIFFMRSFMDDVSYDFPRGGGTIVKMTKRV